MERVVNGRYPGGISPAIKDLMWSEVQKSKERQIQLDVGGVVKERVQWR
jgi:hypothetical protein